MGDQDAVLPIRIPKALKQRIADFANKRLDKMPVSVMIRQWIAERLEAEEKAAKDNIKHG